MKTSLDHLSPSKRSELNHIVAVLKEEFEKARASGTKSWRREGKILKIILYGSFARGDWVDDRMSGYQSDWDLLVIVNREKHTEIEEFWWEADERLMQDKAVRRPLNFIVHSLAQVNEALTQGAYFWVDVVREGIALFECGRRQLTTPQPLAPTETYEIAKKYFDYYESGVARRLTTFHFQFDQHRRELGWRKEAAFTLHQAVEALYHCFLLVYTLYLPKSHNIKLLRSQSEALDKRLAPAWPRETKREDSRFKRLKRAYVDARYSERYEISAEDLEALIICAQKLKGLVDDVCRERLEKLRKRAE